MNIAEALRTARDADSGQGRCKLMRHLDSIPADIEGRDDLAATIEDPDGWRAAWVAQAFRNLGLAVSPSTVTSHRRGECACQSGAA